MGKIFSAIDRQIIRPRVNTAYAEGYQATKEDIESFYIVPEGSVYKRTHAYGESPNSTPPHGVNGDYDYNIRLDDPTYTTGTYDGHTVLEEAQYHGSGILGRAGTWYEAQEDIRQAIENNFK